MSVQNSQVPSGDVQTPGQPWDIEYSNAATEQDIYYCFRLLLGRNPQREHWPGHSAFAGQPLADVVRHYVNSAEFKARKLMDAQLPPGITHRHNGKFHLFADPDDLVLGAPALLAQYEPAVAATLERLLKPGDTFVDIGANIGYFALYTAPLVGPEGRVYAIEPNDLNVKLLEKSRELNGFDNITVMQVAASDRAETLLLHATSGNGSTSEAGMADIFAQRTVPGLPLDMLLSDRTGPVSAMKIDVEGFEYKALKGANDVLRKDRPAIVFEFSNEGLAGISGPDFLHWLEGFGYRFEQLSQTGTGASRTVDQVMQDFAASGIDHIDVLARPD